MTRRTIALVCVWTLPSAICLAATAIVYAMFRIAPPDRLDAGERAQVLGVLRAALDDQTAAAPPVHRPLSDPRRGPLAVTVWSGGRPIVRVDGTGADVAAATADTARRLRAAPAVRAMSSGERAGARLQVDIVSGTGPLGGGGLDRVAIPSLGDMLAINPGVDGIGAEIDGRPALLLPHELVAAKLLSAKRPTEVVSNLAMGVDLAQIGRRLAARAGVTAAIAPGALYRFRTDSFVEAPGSFSSPGAPLPLYRGLPPAPRLSAQALRDAALAGGRYLVAHVGASGRYIYEHDLWTGATTDPTRLTGAYSLPRHAGTTYFLAELYRFTHEPWLREPIERAFAHLVDLLGQGNCGGALPDGAAFDCVIDRAESLAQLGSTALTVVALAEYQRATGDARYLPLAQKLTAWLLFMQRPDGSFRHLYNPRTRAPDDNTQLPYYSGEAALALARMHVVTGEPRYAAAAERALDWLVDWYDFFLGGFFYGEEHWTCIAAEALWPAAKRDKYLAYCGGYGAFLRAQQAEPGENLDQDDYAGAYNLTAFVAPYNTPVGSRTEAMVSTYLLGKHHGTPDPEVAGQIRAALQYALGQQIRPDSAFNVVGPGDGAIPASPIDRNIRIDYVQHVCSAMIRAAEALDWAAPAVDRAADRTSPGS